MSINKLAHVVYECKYHIVVIPKYRYKIFTKDVKKELRDEIKKLCQWLQVDIIEGNVCKDHVHLCLSIPPKHAVAEVIGAVKGKSAIRMFNKFPELRKKYWGSHFWRMSLKSLEFESGPDTNYYTAIFSATIFSPCERNSLKNISILRYPLTLLNLSS